MTTDESRACLERAEALLRKAAEQLIKFPLDPGCVCDALESAKLSLEAVRKNSRFGDHESAAASRRLRYETARVQGLLEGAAVLSFRCGSAAGPTEASYTAAGEFQSASRSGCLVFQA